MPAGIEMVKRIAVHCVFLITDDKNLSLLLYYKYNLACLLIWTSFKTMSDRKTI